MFGHVVDFPPVIPELKHRRIWCLHEFLPEWYVNFCFYWFSCYSEMTLLLV